MSEIYLNIYNNFVKLTRNKVLFEQLIEKETFSDRLILFLFHFGFFLKIYKNNTNKEEMQKLHDFVFKQIELSVREIGYGDVTINKKMKEFVNMFYFILTNIKMWNHLDNDKKRDVLLKNLNFDLNSDFFVIYFDKYINYLKKNSFNYFTKDVIRHNF